MQRLSHALARCRCSCHHLLLAPLASAAPLRRPLATRAERAAAQSAAAARPGLPQMQALFARLEAGLVGMAAANPGFVVRRAEGGAALVIDTGRDVLQVTGDPATGRLSYCSPKVGHGGGVLTYALNAATGEWCCEADGHFLIELLTRELIFHRPGGLKGVPSW
jgi:hypothetical protein